MNHGRSRRQAARKAQRLMEVEQNIATDYCHYEPPKRAKFANFDRHISLLIFLLYRLSILLRIQNFQLRYTNFLIGWSVWDIDKSELSFTNCSIINIL